jgi:hypothetical protein
MSMLPKPVARYEAAQQANREDATMWRWFCNLYDEGRIRWCRANDFWLVSIDHKHLATEQDFDDAMRSACASLLAMSTNRRKARSARRTKIRFPKEPSPLANT